MVPQLTAADDELLVKELRDRLGDDLRSVALHERRDYEVAYRRDDLSSARTAEELDHIVEELVVQRIHQSRLGELFHAGSLDCLLLAFESSLVVYAALDAHAGLLVTIERGASADVETIAGTVQKHA